MSPAPAEAPGVLVADPTLFIAICWILSVLVLGGLVLHAILEAKAGK